jgi:hypothetical protein
VSLTVREQILQAIVTRLALIPGIAEVTRETSGDPSRFPALVVMDGDQQPIEREPSVSRYEMSPGIWGYVEGEDGPAVASARTKLYGDVVAALITEPPLDGLAETIEEGALDTRPGQLGALRRLEFGLTFNITYATKRGAPTEQ